ncbi:MAG: hypothetical protein ABL953_12490 [Ilumatobacteraceae bacterium]
MGPQEVLLLFAIVAMPVGIFATGIVLGRRLQPRGGAKGAPVDPSKFYVWQVTHPHLAALPSALVFAAFVTLVGGFGRLPGRWFLVSLLALASLWILVFEVRLLLLRGRTTECGGEQVS